MDQYDARLERILRKYGLTQCPTCRTFLTAANIRVGWNTRAEDDAVFPTIWMTCTNCGKPVRPPVHVTRPDGRFVQSLDEAIEALVHD